MPKNLIYLCKNKLVGLEGMLSILMEIKALSPKINIIIILVNKGHLRLVKKNYNMWEVMQSISSSIYVSRVKNKFIMIFRIAYFMAKVLFKENIIIRDGGAFPRLIKILKIFSKTKEIKTFLEFETIEAYKNRNVLWQSLEEKTGMSARQSLFSGSYDFFLSILDHKQFRELLNLEAPEGKIVKVGYVRRLPEWQRYVNMTIDKNRAINNSPYFLYILTTLGQMKEIYSQPDIMELLEESLNALKKYNGKIGTVFRPHPNTDIKRFAALLKKIDYSNYAIDYGHPMVLASKAKFVFGNCFSHTMYDAYYLGKPIVEYCQYDKELFIRMGRRSWGAVCCDFFIWRDKKRLEEVLEKVININVNVIRDPRFIHENFPDTPYEFYEFWKRMLRDERGVKNTAETNL